MESKKSVLVASALSALALAGCMHNHSAKKDGAADSGAMLAKGECHGVNACKGQGACHGADHACGGRNACKGQGWITMTQADCESKGGTFKK